MMLLETCSRLCSEICIKWASDHRPWHSYMSPVREITSSEESENLLKLMSKGIPKASAQWTCANAGGFEIIASAANVRPVRGHRE